jgi:hypothetical protein
MYFDLLLGVLIALVVVAIKKVSDDLGRIERNNYLDHAEFYYNINRMKKDLDEIMDAMMKCRWRK